MDEGVVIGQVKEILTLKGSPNDSNDSADLVALTIPDVREPSSHYTMPRLSKSPESPVRLFEPEVRA